MSITPTACTKSPSSAAVNGVETNASQLSGSALLPLRTANSRLVVFSRSDTPSVAPPVSKRTCLPARLAALNQSSKVALLVPNPPPSSSERLSQVVPSSSAVKSRPSSSVAAAAEDVSRLQGRKRAAGVGRQVGCYRSGRISSPARHSKPRARSNWSSARAGSGSPNPPRPTSAPIRAS